jgi:hypothetical protein
MVRGGLVSAHAGLDWGGVIRLRLVREKKIFECHIGCVGRMLGGVFDTNKKINYRTRQKTARRI